MLKRFRPGSTLVMALSFVALVSAGCAVFTRVGVSAGPVISNCQPRRTADGQIVDAHDGCLQKFGDRYYLYGTAYGTTDGFNKNNRYRCYSSADLVTWKLEGELLTNPPDGVYYRPYVVYNKATRKYVLWYNWYATLWEGQYGVATSDTPQGPFVIQNGNVKVAHAKPGDLNLLVDDDGSAYIIYTTIADKHSISIDKLTPDYLSSTLQNSGFLGSGSEAPAIFKRGKLYYALFDKTCCFGPEGSGARVFTAEKPLGPYTERGNINRDDTGKPIIAAQQTYVAQLPTPRGTVYIWMGDRWGSRPDGVKGHDFQYWSYPLEFNADGSIQPLRWDCRIGDKNFVPPKAGAARPAIVITKATYGDAASGRQKDVTEAVRRKVAAGAECFQVASLVEDGDPAFGVVKKLVVEYRLDGRPATASATDPEHLDLLLGK